MFLEKIKNRFNRFGQSIKPASLKKEARSRLLVTFVWLLIISLIRWRWYLPFGQMVLGMIGLWLGALVGTFLLEVDHLLYTLVIYPHELTGQRIKQYFQKNRFQDILILLYDTRSERVKLTFHSALFQIVFWGLCFFVLTSTGSLFGAGMVMAAALQLLRSEVLLILEGQEEYLRKRLFWQIKKEFTFRQQKAFVVLMILSFVALNLFLI